MSASRPRQTRSRSAGRSGSSEPYVLVVGTRIARKNFVVSARCAAEAGRARHRSGGGGLGAGLHAIGRASAHATSGLRARAPSARSLRRARWRSRCPRSTRASACRCSRPWRAACRSWPPIARPCRRPAAARRCWWTPTTPSALADALVTAATDEDVRSRADPARARARRRLQLESQRGADRCGHRRSARRAADAARDRRRRSHHPAFGDRARLVSGVSRLGADGGGDARPLRHAIRRSSRFRRRASCCPSRLASAIVRESRLARLPGRPPARPRSRALALAASLHAALLRAARPQPATRSWSAPRMPAPLGVNAPADALHLCYCYTPMRYVWMPEAERGRARGLKGLALTTLRGRLRAWDRRASQRPDVYVAISSAVADRIARFYGREAAVVHPPVAVSDFASEPERDPRRFLWVHRLVPYKRPLEVAAAFRDLPDLRLTMVGVGPLEAELRANLPRNVELLGVDAARPVGPAVRRIRRLHPRGRGGLRRQHGRGARCGHARRWPWIAAARETSSGQTATACSSRLRADPAAIARGSTSSWLSASGIRGRSARARSASRRSAFASSLGQIMRAHGAR